MEDGRIPKNDLYSRLTSNARRVGRPAVRFRDACKRDIESAQVSIEEAAAADRINWRQAVRSGMRKAKERRN